MLPVDELERLSRYLADELGPQERLEVDLRLSADPASRAALESLRAVERAAAALPRTASPEHLEALLQRVERPGPLQARRRTALVGGVALFAVLAVTGLWVVAPWGRGPPPQVLVVSPPVSLDGQARSLGTQLAVAPGARVETGPEGAGAAVTVTNGTWLVPQGSSVALHPEAGLDLVRGAVLGIGGPLEVRTPVGAVRIQGSALVTVEPREALGRVTTAFDQDPSGGAMKKLWTRWGPPALAAAAGAGLTVFVMDGRAIAQPGDGPDILVAAGERWSAGEKSPTRAGGGTHPPSLTSSAQALGGPSAEVEEPVPAELSRLDRPALLALAQRLRDEREKLLAEKYALKNALDAARAPAKVNHYRMTPEELTRLAEQGETLFRLPQFDGGKLQYGDAARDEVRLTPEEERAIAALYERSGRRLREGLLGLYQEIGGDPNTAQALGNFALLNELKSKTLGDDATYAIRRVARERAGLEPSGAPGEGSPVLRAFRLLWHEDDRVIAELEQLLGQVRTEQLLNHESTRHSDHGFGVGPEKKGR